MEPPPPSMAPMLWRDLRVALIALLLLLAWDLTGWDMALALPIGSVHGFDLQHHWFLERVSHEGARRAAWLPALWLIAGIWWPTGPLRRLTKADRIEWAVLLLLALAVVSALKQQSLTSCPWDLAQFGGHARLHAHWTLMPDGGPGRCFPAGHSAAGFAYFSGYFVLRRSEPRAANWCLVAASAAGLLFGIAQQLRGAHFMSHTLWTAWLCWITCWLGDLTLQRWARPSAQSLLNPPGRS